MKESLPNNPIQPLVVDSEGVVRYKRNEAIQAMYDALQSAGIDPFAAIMKSGNISEDDFGQFNQLLGHSHAGANGQWGITEEVYQAARTARESGVSELEARNRYLERRHTKMVKKLAPLVAHVFNTDIDDLEPR